ncbi:MAG: tRNA (guanine-N7-)-methyltransferase [Phycisphaerales bacterium]|nr:tRNA (guanine-N7-)-methyltransferase [Phycisphaerales bacterium]
MTVPAPARRSVYADRLLEFRDFVFSDGAEFQPRGAWRDFFNSRIGPTFDGRVIFEIGCNDGGLLARVAAKYPATAFIGIDWKYRALHSAAERVAAAGLRNVALLHGRAQDIRRLFADGELDEVWVFHPEPCDNPRELPNRLLAEPFLLNVHHVLRDAGSLILKTDHRGYFDSVLELLGGMNDRFDAGVVSTDFWADSTAQSAVAARAFAGEVTAFEQRFVRKRKPIYFFEIRRR